MYKKIHPRTVIESIEQTPNSVLSIDQVSSLTGLSRSHLYAHISKGNLRARKSGSRTIVLTSDIKIFLNNLPTLPTRAA
jgi:excisionase family DNA binding protein